MDIVRTLLPELKDIVLEYLVSSDSMRYLSKSTLRTLDKCNTKFLSVLQDRCIHVEFTTGEFSAQWECCGEWIDDIFISSPVIHYYDIEQLDFIDPVIAGNEDDITNILYEVGSIYRLR